MNNKIKISITLAVGAVVLLAYFSLTRNDSPGQATAHLLENFAFECHYEINKLPPVSPEAEDLYRYALCLESAQGPKDFDDVARYYRIAAAHNHFKAATNLQSILSAGFISTAKPATEMVNLAENLWRLAPLAHITT